jgi:hypothetical protein
MSRLQLPRLSGPANHLSVATDDRKRLVASLAMIERSDTQAMAAAVASPERRLWPA